MLRCTPLRLLLGLLSVLLAALCASTHARHVSQPSLQTHYALLLVGDHSTTAFLVRNACEDVGSRSFLRQTPSKYGAMPAKTLARLTLRRNRNNICCVFVRSACRMGYWSVLSRVTIVCVSPSQPQVQSFVPCFKGTLGSPAAPPNSKYCSSRSAAETPSAVRETVAEAGPKAEECPSACCISMASSGQPSLPSKPENIQGRELYSNPGFLLSSMLLSAIILSSAWRYQYPEEKQPERVYATATAFSCSRKNAEEGPALSYNMFRRRYTSGLRTYRSSSPNRSASPRHRLILSNGAKFSTLSD